MLPRTAARLANQRVQADAGPITRAVKAKEVRIEIEISYRQCLVRWRPLFFQISR